MTIRVEALHVDECVDNSEDEGDDDPCYGCSCSNGPGVGLFESVDETLPPTVVLREDYEGCEETASGGQTQGNLLEVDESLDSVLVTGVFDGRETVVGPTSIDSREGERERCEGGRSNSEDNCGISIKILVH